MRFLLAFVLALAACLALHAATNDDFDVSGKYQQHVPLIGPTTVLIRCYCPTRTIERVPGAPDIELRISGNYSSVGYHGHQEKPKELPREMLEFVEKRSPDAIILESRERTIIHHAFIVNELIVRAPSGIDVRFEPVERSALERRSTK